MSNPSLELAARMPWIHAKGETWWHVTGKKTGGEAFTDCIARVMPEFITGVEGSPLFEILVYAAPFYVTAAEISAAKELLFVLADDPREALYDDDQRTVDDAMEAKA